MADSGQAKSIAVWIASGLLAALFVFAGGVGKLYGGVAEPVAHFGYPVAFMYFIGACEVAGAIGLLIPRLASLAACGLSILMAGAAVSHLVAGDGIARAAFPAGVLVLLVGIAIVRRSAFPLRRAPEAA